MKSKTLKFQGGCLDYEIITSDKPDTIDPVPHPSYFGLKSYTYLSWIWVDKKHRKQGKAKQAIEQLLSKNNSVLTLLYKQGDFNGFVLKRLLRKHGLRSIPNLLRKTFGPTSAKEFCFMFRKSLDNTHPIC